MAQVGIQVVQVGTGQFFFGVRIDGRFGHDFKATGVVQDHFALNRLQQITDTEVIFHVVLEEYEVVWFADINRIEIQVLVNGHNGAVPFPSIREPRQYEIYFL
jgi:hypothetical protein